MAISLSEWIARNRLTNKDFASLIAPHMGRKVFSFRTVETWKRGEVMPRKKALEAIAAVTDGEVTYESFLKVPEHPSC